MRRTLVAGFLALALNTCAISNPEPAAPLLIDGLKFENQTDRQITAIRLLLPETGGFVSCGNIAGHSMCSTTFPETTYTGNPVEVTWSQSGQIYSTGKFSLSLPDDIDESAPVTVLVVIAGPGSAGAMIVQKKTD
jgi:hypothetical protein